MFIKAPWNILTQHCWFCTITILFGGLLCFYQKFTLEDSTGSPGLVNLTGISNYRPVQSIICQNRVAGRSPGCKLDVRLKLAPVGVNDSDLLSFLIVSSWWPPCFVSSELIYDHWFCCFTGTVHNLRSLYFWENCSVLLFFGWWGWQWLRLIYEN